MPRGIPVDAPGNPLAAGTRPRGDVLGGERRARCDDSVMSGSQVSYQDVEVHEGAPGPSNCHPRLGLEASAAPITVVAL